MDDSSFLDPSRYGHALLGLAATGLLDPTRTSAATYAQCRQCVPMGVVMTAEGADYLWQFCAIATVQCWESDLLAI